MSVIKLLLIMVIVISVIKLNLLFSSMIIKLTRSYYLERPSALDFKDATTPRFGHRNVAFDLFRFSQLMALLSNFSKGF